MIALSALDWNESCEKFRNRRSMGREGLSADEGTQDGGVQSFVQVRGLAKTRAIKCRNDKGTKTTGVQERHIRECC